MPMGKIRTSRVAPGSVPMNLRRCAAVLVVEDEVDIREAIVAFLEYQGFDVYEAGNGQQALEVLKRIPQPALVLADLMMPVMDGPTLIAALRKDDKFATLPVVIVSAASHVPGMEGYRRIKKPIDLDDLAHMVDEFCSKRA
jgi:CheY-like chemotaxis protein